MSDHGIPTYVDLSHMNTYGPEKLQTVYQELIVKRMKLDKKFSDFLAKNEDKMGEDVGTAIWNKYHEMNATYTKIVKAITLCKHYMKML